MALSTLEWGLVALLMLFPLLWQFSHAFRYYLKNIFLNCWIMISAIIVIPLALPRPGNVENMRYVKWLLHKGGIMLGLRFQVRNHENLTSAPTPCVVVCNHQSSVDTIGMLKMMPPRTTVLVKKELLYAGPFGAASWLCGIVFVDRSNRSKAHEVMANTAKIMHDRKLNIWIFPEGTRNFNGKMLQFKKGAFHLAIQAKVPIYPVVFSSYRNFLNTKAKVFNTGEVIISCLPPVSTEGLTIDDVTKLTEQVQSVMEMEYERISTDLKS